MPHEPKEVDFLQKQIEQFVESQRPAKEIRNKLDLGYEWKKNTLTLFEIRPFWKDANIIRHYPFAKARFIKSRNIWKIYWMRASLKWESYPPEPEVARLDQVLKIIEEDKHHCFKG
jgi:hypothetical protein